MKKILLFIAIAGLSFNSKAQNILAQWDFSTYDGTIGSVAPGWFCSVNDTGTFKTFYTTSGSCGISCPAYKFGNDSIYVTSPTFSNGAFLRFYMKGNGTPNPYNTFYVEANVGGTWSTIQTYNPISATAITQNVTLPAGTQQVKFYFNKDSLGYNVGLDDVIIADAPLSTNSIANNETIGIYPSVTKGAIKVDLKELFLSNVTLTVSNVLGKELKRSSYKSLSGILSVNLTELPDGIYIVKVKSASHDITRRIILSR
jgi:Secretion system C-terminal sorting domain